MGTVSRVSVPPMDEHNEKLVEHVHPSDWTNPTPSSKYQLVVIGAGTAGLVTAAGAAGIGAKVALIERNLMGGDCLNVGCVPSKCMIRSGRTVAEIRAAAQFGVRVPGEPEVDFGAVMERMRRLRAEISHVDSAARFRDEFGVDVYLGDAHFTDRNTIEVAGQTLKFGRAVIATGARAVAPPIEGLEEAGYLTNETIFNLTERPRRVCFIGSGPIGCELAQTFQLLGSEVTLVEALDRIMNREDPDASKIVDAQLRRDGVTIELGAKVQSVRPENDEKVVTIETEDGAREIRVDTIVVGVGRKPNVDGLGLEQAGVEYDERQGVQVDDYLQTTNPAVYAAGDCCMVWKFTHAADFAARTVIRNALFSMGPFGKGKLSDLVMPWCTYTHPEVAHVGAYERELDEQGVSYQVFTQEFEHVDRAIADGDTEGFVKVLVKSGTDEILGGTIVARNAGDMIGELTSAMVNGIGLGKVANVIHPYPTQAEAIRKLGDQYNKTKLTPSVAKWMKRYLNWRF